MIVTVGPDDPARAKVRARFPALPADVQSWSPQIVFPMFVLFEQSAVDRERSVWKPHAEKGKIRLFKSLALTPASVKANLPAFRLAEMRDAVLVREDLVAAAKEAGLTGLRFIEPAKFNSM